jgi:hypothetical protein
MLKSLLGVLGVVIFILFVWAAAVRYKTSRFQGRTAQQWVEILRTDSGPAEDILKPRRVSTGEKPWVITFEVPIACYKLGNHPELHRVGTLGLLVDGQSVSANFGDTNNDDCTNGNCLLRWRLDGKIPAPGMHQIQVQLLIGGESGTRLLEARGPIISILLNNPKW